MSLLAEDGTLPPAVRFVVGNLVVEGVEGSSTWRGIARDRLLKPPETWVPLSAGTMVRFQSSGRPPDQAFLTVYQASSVADGSMAASAGIDLNPRQPSWVVDLPPGRYVITLSRTWAGSDSVSHGLGIEVHGFDAV